MGFVGEARGPAANGVPYEKIRYIFKISLICRLIFVEYQMILYFIKDLV